MGRHKLDIAFYPDLITPTFATEVFSTLIDTMTWNKQMTSRYTESFGVPYRYSGMSYDEKKMPKVIQAMALIIAREVGYLPNNCLINYYLNGNSKMGFHSDDTSQLEAGTGVAILSLGAAREMLFKHKTSASLTQSFCLTSGSLIYMDDRVQKEWLHSIPKSDTQAGRISLTFRKLIQSS